MRDSAIVTITQGPAGDAHWYVMTGDGRTWRDWMAFDNAVLYATNLLDLLAQGAVPFICWAPEVPLVEPFTSYRVIRR